MKSPSKTPWVTLLLIATCFAASFALVLQPEIAESYGFFASKPELLAMFASLALHANLLHLLGNMVFLAAVGPSIEISTGAARFAAVYVSGGLIGVGLHYLMASGSDRTEPLIGASGCVASVIAYYSIRYSHVRVPLAPKFGVPVWVVALFWLAIQALGAFLRIGDAAGVAFWSHLGGFASGLCLGLVFRAPAVSELQRSHEWLVEMGHRSPAAVLAASEEHLSKFPNDERALRAQADALQVLGDVDHEVEARLRLISISGGDVRVEQIQRLSELCALSKLPPVQRLRIAEECRSSHREVAIRVLESVAAEPGSEAFQPDAMLALAEVERRERPDASGAWVRRLLDQYPMHPAAEVARRKGLVE